jgi:hypothetical protein
MSRSSVGSEDSEGYFEQTADDSKPYETYKCDLVGISKRQISKIAPKIWAQFILVLILHTKVMQNGN